MKEKNVNFRAVRFGLFINKQYPWLNSCVCVTALGRIVARLNVLTVLKTATLRVMFSNLLHAKKRTSSRKTTSSTVSARSKFLLWRGSSVTL